MDNKSIDISSIGTESLELALELVWNMISCANVSHYKVVNLEETTEYITSPTKEDPGGTYHLERTVESRKGTQTLILLRSDEGNSQKLVYSMDLRTAKALVVGWLEQADYGEKFDFDGDFNKGWRVLAGDSGEISGYRSIVVRIQAIWALSGV